MSSVDDILFEPIGKPTLAIDQNMIDAIKRALTGQVAVDFVVKTDIHFDTYEIIADLVENDKTINKYVAKMVARNNGYNLRPADCLTIKDAFRLIYNGQDSFWICGSTSNGVHERCFSNWFSIDTRIPVIAIENATASTRTLHEWWTLGLMSQFVGFDGYYTFGSAADAYKYFTRP